jgi:hypothetical protein
MREASNYVAKLRADALRAKHLKPLGHILDFATFPVKCCRQHFMRENFTYGSMRGCWRRDHGADCGTGAVAKAAGNRYSPLLSWPRQHPTLQIENVLGYLPEHLKDQTQAAMRAAFRLPAREGMARLEKQADWLEREYPSAATSLREGLAEMFTVSRLGLSPSLARCLVSTNVLESPHSGVRLRTRLPLAGREDGPVLGRRGPGHNRTKLPQDYGLPGSVDAEGCLGSERRIGSTGGSVG